MEIRRDCEFESIGKGNHTKQGMLSFAESDKFVSQAIRNPNIRCLIVSAELVDAVPEALGLIVAEAPRLTFYEIHEALIEKSSFFFRGEDTQVASTALVAKSAELDPKDVVIEDEVLVEPGAIIMRGSIIRKSSIIRAGAVIGADGFEFYRVGGEVRPVQHAGTVDIGEGVEVQALAVVEKAVYGGATIIGSYSKLGSRVLIAHNSVIGQRCLIAGGAIVSGNVSVGDDVWIGPGAVISNGISLGDNCRVTIGSCVVESVDPSAEICGLFGSEKHKMMKFMARSGIIQ